MKIWEKNPWKKLSVKNLIQLIKVMQGLKLAVTHSPTASVFLSGL